MIKTDSHVHSVFSPDSQSPLASMIEQALNLDFTRFYLTDHMDYDFPVIDGEIFQFDPDDYFREITEAQETWQDRLKIFPGVEVGLQFSCFPAIQDLLSSYPFDVVIGSVHLAAGNDPYDPAYWEGKTVGESMDFYLESTLELLHSCPPVDILGHLDYALRYAPSKEGYPTRRTPEILDAILQALLQKNIALEINTSNLAKSYVPNPDYPVIQRYYELGGRLITIGSDAHTPDRLGASFSLIRERLLSVGFREYALFEHRSPIFLPL